RISVVMLMMPPTQECFVPLGQNHQWNFRTMLAVPRCEFLRERQDRPPACPIQKATARPRFRNRTWGTGVGRCVRTISWYILRVRVRLLKGREVLGMKTAKLFRNGRSQAVRLPAEFRFEGQEVFIRKDEKTGDVILSKRPESWDEFFRIRDAAIKADPRAFAEFMSDRKDEPPQKRELFG